MVLGVFLAPRLNVRRPLILTAAGTAAYALPLAAFGLSAPMPVVATAYLIAMFGLGILIPLWATDGLGRWVTWTSSGGNGMTCGAQP